MTSLAGSFAPAVRTPREGLGVLRVGHPGQVTGILRVACRTNWFELSQQPGFDEEDFYTVDDVWSPPKTLPGLITHRWEVETLSQRWDIDDYRDDAGRRLRMIEAEALDIATIEIVRMPVKAMTRIITSIRAIKVTDEEHEWLFDLASFDPL